MKIRVKEEPIKAVLFFISEDEAVNEELMNFLNSQFHEWKLKGYLPTVFESGKGSLEDNMYSLMKYNTEILAKKRVMKKTIYPSDDA